MANAAFGTPGGVGYVDPFQPQPVTPTAPVASTPTVNPNAQFQTNVAASALPTAQPAPTSQVPPGNTSALPGQAQQATPVGQPTQPAGQTAQIQQSLVIPANGSVVDLLNSQDEDSSQAARQKLAASYGIKGYDFSASKNTELAQKYIDAHNQLKNTAQQDSGGAAKLAVQNTIQQNQAATEQDAQKTMYDVVASMNPVEKQLYDVTQQALSSVGTQQMAAEEYTKAFTDVNNPAGIPGESLSQGQLQMINWKKIMDGSEDDIRTEVTKAGGFATESQVAAMTVARNKTLLKQATYLQQSMALKQDYVDNLMRYSQIDRDAAEKQVDRKTGLAQSLVDMTDKIDNAAKDNYQKLVDSIGYDGLAASFDSYPQGKAFAEQALGLAPGALSDKTFLDNSRTLKQQQLDATKAQQALTNELAQQRIDQGNQKIQISLNNSGTLDTYRQAMTDLAQSRANSADATAVNSTIRTLYPMATSNPINAYNSAAIWIGNVNSAYAQSIDPKNNNKGASDLELLDAAVKLNNGGQQVTQVQVDELLKSISFGGKASVQGGKIIGISGLMDTGTRTAIKDLAVKNLASKKSSANEAVSRINTELQNRGYKSALDLPSISAMSGTDTLTNLAQENGFDLQSARDAGYSDEEISSYLQGL